MRTENETPETLIRQYASPSEATQLAHLAIGRLLGMMSRPFQEGDVAEYYRLQDIIMTAREVSGAQPFVDKRPNWVTDRLKGAQGD